MSRRWDDVSRPRDRDPFLGRIVAYCAVLIAVCLVSAWIMR